MLQQENDQAEQVIDLISVTPGLENALAIAVGEALTASLDTHAAMHWRSLGPLSGLPTLPVGIAPIAEHIKAPPALARCLSQIGLVERSDEGAVAAVRLKPGQIIVSRDGWAWRWDGFTVTPQARTATALRLQQHNRRDALVNEIAVAEAEAVKAAKVLDDSSLFLSRTQADDKQAREALEAAFAALNDAHATYAEQEKQTTAVTTKLAALDEQLRQTNDDLEQIRLRAHAIADERAGFPDAGTQAAEIARARTTLAEKRNIQSQRQGERDHLAREQEHCAARGAAIMEEIAAWQKRLENATQQIAALDERIAAFNAGLAQLRAKPEELAAARTRLLTELGSAETRRKDATDRLIEAEQKLEGIEHKLKQDEAALVEAREARVRAEGAVQAAAEHFTTLRERISEKLSCGPEELLAIAAFGEDETPPASELEQALARYLRERENMGPVNLRAETEAETMQGEIDKLQKERDDLTGAIAKLRQGISQLNREARERLQNAFAQVNGRFEALFKSLFGGGRAYLQFIDNEDPMEAGLEIFASPPGKKMQILSLLSGGERTLTALALLFAVFQTNPSPICVLDEAEAALDESNIDRFCSLVETIARETGTRFLIITHQRLTMARMDRLYGVTMSEKGVSQMVSVDLAGAVAIRDGADTEALESAASKVEDALEGVRAA
jgi:chromosome segregation protein